MKKRNLFILLLITLCFTLTAQEISEKKELAVFSLSYYNWNIPGQALGLVDAQITDVFVNLGRFTVLGMTYRLSSADVGTFIEQIRKVKEENVEISEQVRLGEVTFTEADFNKLTGSFIVVVPVLAGYTNEMQDDGSFEANLTTTFTFINVETQETFSQINVDTVGTGDSAAEALRNAADGIAPSLTFEVRSIPEFTLKTGIVEVLNRRTILLEFGRNMGVKKGDEFAITRGKILDSGHQLTTETGLIKISEVDTTLSYGYVLYSANPPVPGDQLKEIPRFGVDATVYLNAVSSGSGTTTILPGFRTAVSRGFYRYRPFIGFEVPLTSATMDLWGLPVNGYFGGEVNWYMGRLLLKPSAAVGIGGILPVWELDENTDFWEDLVWSHLGGFVEIQASYLLTRDLRVNVNVGFAYWKSIYGGFLGAWAGEDYGGSMVGAGITWKF